MEWSSAQKNRGALKAKTCKPNSDNRKLTGTLIAFGIKKHAEGSANMRGEDVKMVKCLHKILGIKRKKHSLNAVQFREQQLKFAENRGRL